jgi:hypothetical protein
MWDPKPDAPAEIRGPFVTISTAITGVRMTEHLPKLARQLSHCALVRSVHHSVRGAHAAAAYAALTGERPEDVPRPAAGQDHPALGSIVVKTCGAGDFPLPYIWLPFQTSEVNLGGRPIPGMLGGFLGSRFDPFFVLDDPSDPDFTVSALEQGSAIDAARQLGRTALLDELDRGSWGKEAARWRELQQQAREVLGSQAIRKVFAVREEPEAVKAAYGENRFGASLLLARRLIEAGCRVVCVSADRNLNQTWDTHFDNFGILQKNLLPKFDAALSALLDDLADRGLLGQTLVMVFGEFGRSPTIGDGNATGRGHWPDCYTALLAGGGIKAGFTFGRSDKFGAFPAEDPVTPADVLATALRCLGVAPNSELVDPLGRPVRVAVDGRAIEGLLV